MRLRHAQATSGTKTMPCSSPPLAGATRTASLQRPDRCGIADGAARSNSAVYPLARHAPRPPAMHQEMWLAIAPSYLRAARAGLSCWMFPRSWKG
ncbi:MAG: hypothetical protein LC776_12335 [Acidobacteria bacterium]|nr:hypothetical protein [Acidobacteriota bacterium]